MNESEGERQRAVRGPRFERIWSAGGDDPRADCLDAAEEELADAEARYEAQRSGLGTGFLSAVSVAIDRALAVPLSASAAVGTPEGLGVRAIQVTKFPYSVVFYQDGSVLWVVAFAHQRRRPGYWRGWVAIDS